MVVGSREVGAGGSLEAERAHRTPRRIRWPLRDRESDTRINRVEACQASNIETKCHHQRQRAPKRHRSIDAEASPMSRYMTPMYGLCDASGHRRQLCVTPLVRHAAPPATLVDS